MQLVVNGNRLKRKRSELIEAFDLDGLDDERIIKVAQKEIAATPAAGSSDGGGTPTPRKLKPLERSAR